MYIERFVRWFQAWQWEHFFFNVYIAISICRKYASEGSCAVNVLKKLFIICFFFSFSFFVVCCGLFRHRKDWMLRLGRPDVPWEPGLGSRGTFARIPLANGRSPISTSSLCCLRLPKPCLFLPSLGSFLQLRIEKLLRSIVFRCTGWTVSSGTVCFGLGLAPKQGRRLPTFALFSLSLSLWVLAL